MSISWLVGTLAGMAGVLIIYLAVRKVRNNAKREVINEIALQANRYAVDELIRREKVEVEIEAKYGPLEAAVFDSPGLLDKLPFESSSNPASQTTIAKLSSKHKQDPANPKRRKLAKFKPRGSR